MPLPGGQQSDKSEFEYVFAFLEVLLWYDQVYKPGSVLTAIYLVPQLLAGSSHLPEAVGPTVCFSTVLLRIEFTALQCSHGAGGLLPHLFTLTLAGGISLLHLS